MTPTMALRSRVSTPAVAVLALSGAIGASIALSAGYAPLLIAGAAAAALAVRWRVGVVVLLVLLPFSGVPAFFAGPAGLGLRDICIVAPLYVAFGVEMTRSRERLLPDLGIALSALGVFSALVLLQTLRAPTILAGAIGARVWLAYLPMLAIGYQFVRTESDFRTLVKLTALLGLVPAVVAIAECAIAVERGSFGPFERMYGAWELTETQRFVVFTTDAGHLRIPRVPSTFTGVSQYFSFALVAYAAALAMAFREGSVRWGACALVLAAGAIASGARAAYVAVPAIGVLSIALAAGSPRRLVAQVTVAAAVCGALAIAFGDGISIAREVPSHAAVTLGTSLDELGSSFNIFGHGTGWDTNAALRYGGVTERRYVESWYAKAMLELGVMGLMAIATAFGAIVWRLVRECRLPSMTPSARGMAAPIAALVIVTMALLVKGPYIDLDPLNVYFWLLLGAVFGLFRTAAQPQARGGA